METTTEGTKETTTTITTPTPPITVSSSPTFYGCEGFMLSLTNISFSPKGGTFQWQSSPTGENNWTNHTLRSSASAVIISAQTISKDYRCLIVTTSPGLMTSPSTVVTVTNAYCAPFSISCVVSDTIDNFVLVGEVATEINDAETGCATDGYDNRTSTSVTLYAGRKYTLDISTLSGEEEYFSLCIDFDANSVFESSELVADVWMFGTSNNAVPVGDSNCSSWGHDWCTTDESNDGL